MPTATLTDIAIIESTFDTLWTQHHAYLLDRQQTALLRCLRDEPDRVLALFDYFISQSLGRIAISDVAPSLERMRWCPRCGQLNSRRYAKYCKQCHDRLCPRRPRRSA